MSGVQAWRLSPRDTGSSPGWGRDACVPLAPYHLSPCSLSLQDFRLSYKDQLLVICSQKASLTLRVSESSSLF